jgi:hypothetical protein
LRGTTTGGRCGLLHALRCPAVFRRSVLRLRSALLAPCSCLSCLGPCGPQHRMLCSQPHCRLGRPPPGLTSTPMAAGPQSMMSTATGWRRATSTAPGGMPSRGRTLCKRPVASQLDTQAWWLCMLPGSGACLGYAWSGSAPTLLASHAVTSWLAQQPVAPAAGCLEPCREPSERRLPPCPAPHLAARGPSGRATRGWHWMQAQGCPYPSGRVSAGWCTWTASPAAAAWRSCCPWALWCSGRRAATGGAA